VNVLILAGGAGTRALHLPPGTPKVLTPVAGRPLLDHLLQYLAAQSATDVALTLCHGREAVLSYLCGGGFTVNAQLRVHCDLRHEARGTVQAIRWAVSARYSGDFHLRAPLVVLNGDTLLGFDLAKVHAWHGGSVGATVVRGWGKEGVPTGVRILGAEALAELQGSSAKDVEDHLWRCDAYTRFVPRGSFLDVGTPAGFARAEEWVAKRGN
jgi:NDP-sugar pyrophosphorylase family protein